MHSLATLVATAAARQQVRFELDEEELVDISVIVKDAHTGRPALARILADETASGSVVVGCECWMYSCVVRSV